MGFYCDRKDGCWLLGAGYWLLVAGCLLLVAGCWLLVACFIQIQHDCESEEYRSIPDASGLDLRTHHPEYSESESVECGASSSLPAHLAGIEDPSPRHFSRHFSRHFFNGKHQKITFHLLFFYLCKNF